MSAIVVTAANEAFYPLLKDCLEALRINNIPRVDIGVFDLGLSYDSIEHIKQITRNIIVPDWDFQVDAHLKATLVRPLLRKYFPNYEYYIWLDCDTWVQEAFALSWLLDAAAGRSIALVPQADRCYNSSLRYLKWRIQRLKACFGEEAGNLYWTNIYYNAGVFCLHVDAPHWDVWAKYQSQGITNSFQEFSGQAALNFAIWSERLPVHALPALCNWCCHLSVPLVHVVQRKLVEPLIPYGSIGITHLTGASKDLKMQLHHQGRSAQASLRFNGIPPYETFV